MMNLALLLASASTAQAWGGFSPYLVDNLHGIGAASPQWKQAIAYSNASSSVSFTGRDVTKPWPASPMDGWTISMTAVDLSPSVMGYDMRLIAPKSLYSTVDPNKVVNDTDATDVELAGGKVITDVNPDWVMCNYVSWGGQSFENPKKAFNTSIPSKPDGDCTGILPDNCIAALEKAAATSYDTYDGYKHFRASCRNFEIPDECDGLDLSFGTDAVYTRELPIKYLTGATTTINGYELAQDKEEEEIDASPRDAPQIWESMTKDYNFVLTTFGHYQRNVTDYQPGFTKLVCIRPEEKEEKEEKDSAGTMVQPALALTVAAMLLLL